MPPHRNHHRRQNVIVKYVCNFMVVIFSPSACIRALVFMNIINGCAVIALTCVNTHLKSNISHLTFFGCC